MDGEAIGQSVEDMVKELYKSKDIVEIDTKHLDYKNRHKSYHELTLKAIDKKADVLYQAGFANDSLFAKTDFLVKNES
jgi:ABC-type branched-subunit amino acid transport system substrate-binding protein